MRLAIFLLLATATLAQQDLRFDVASIKPHVQNYQGFSMNINSNGRFAARNYSVWNLIRMAFDLRDLQIAEAPAWIKSQGFDIQANPAGPVPRERTLLMLRSLLADRFHLTFHRVTRQQSGYALRIANRGRTLLPPREGGSRTLLGDFDVASMKLTVFCRTLEYELDRPVQNETGLDGPLFDHTAVVVRAHV